MKKTVSMFAVAAIVVALASSFTTSKFALGWFTAKSPAVGLSVEQIANFNTTPFSGDVTVTCPSVSTADKTCAIQHEYSLSNPSVLDQADLNSANPAAIRYIP